ncbi:uncharacterized protein E0L32_008965 [Thyridium curvatum]|uniref:Ras modification protein ERF4 n=1 Tax=Thyridium curvatum TaxID=1093900 RepID=A0A507ATF9_9PEZI|nr:uncharacterized protein E0L32_008965 [Thyridium curvatum]TPX09774.1 hypothetical protein E0L32_008965 [Thyridium curvatum]
MQETPKVHGGRLLGGHRSNSSPTAPHAPEARPSHPAPPATLDASTNPRITPTPFRQPIYPGGASTSSPEPPLAAYRPPERGRDLPTTNAPRQRLPQLPFRNRAGNSFFQPRSRAARLWNPTNSTPRPRPSRRRRASTPPPPAVPLSHPTLASSALPADSSGARAGDYPLLTLPEQRQIRHSTSTRPTSLHIDQGGSDRRISLPKSVRHSYDEKRLTPTTPQDLSESNPFGLFFPKDETTDTRDPRSSIDQEPKRLDKGKGKEIMSPSENEEELSSARGYSKDLERGPDVLGQQRHSTASMPDGIGSALSSSNSSIMGDPDAPQDAGEEWGPSHPCYPHLNPHVPVDSPEYTNTRIIRIRRDWLLEGDLAPTFSNLYPEILDPAGLSEQEFRRVIEKLNGELVPIFNPYSWRNILDGVLGLATGWLWEDFGMTSIKTRLSKLEQWIEQWNIEMEKTAGSDDSTVPPKIIPLRQTGYMSLDIQIGDPEIAPAPSTPARTASAGAHEPLASAS